AVSESRSGRWSSWRACATVFIAAALIAAVPMAAVPIAAVPICIPRRGYTVRPGRAAHTCAARPDSFNHPLDLVRAEQVSLQMLVKLSARDIGLLTDVGHAKRNCGSKRRPGWPGGIGQTMRL